MTTTHLLGVTPRLPDLTQESGAAPSTKCVNARDDNTNCSVPTAEIVKSGEPPARRAAPRDSLELAIRDEQQAEDAARHANSSAAAGAHKANIISA